MGKITGNTVDDVKVKVSRSSNQGVCGAELVGYLACLDHNNNNEQQCLQTKRALFDCMEVASLSGATQRRHKPALNYHIRMVCTRNLPAHPCEFSSTPWQPLKTLHVLVCTALLSHSFSARSARDERSDDGAARATSIFCMAPYGGAHHMAAKRFRRKDLVESSVLD